MLKYGVFLSLKKERRVIFMDLNYAIFRSEPINNLNDLAQIGLHNKREKKLIILIQI